MRALASAISLVFVLVVTGCVAPPAPGEQSQALGYPNDQPAFDFFIGQGLTGYQAAGIVGNFDVESGVDPNSVQSGGPGRGIAQWTAGARWDTTSNDNAVWYAGTIGESVTTLDAQLKFTWYELTTFSSYGLAALQATTNVHDATIAFMSSFEGCGACSASTRVSDAQNVLATYGSDMVDFAGAAPPPDIGNSGVPCMISTGEAGTCIDTGACAALGNYKSTPGFCPGAANIECCTPTSTPMMMMGDAGVVATHHKGGCDATGGGAIGGTLFVLLALVGVRMSRRVV